MTSFTITTTPIKKIQGKSFERSSQLRVEGKIIIVVIVCPSVCFVKGEEKLGCKIDVNVNT